MNGGLQVKRSYWFLLAGFLWAGSTGPALGAGFTPLTPVPNPTIASLSPVYSNGQLALANFIDGDLKTEFASMDQGTNTVVEFGFNKPTEIAAIRHVDRNDSATIVASEFEFLDARGARVALVPMVHANQRHGETFFILPSPVTAEKVRWRVTKPASSTLYSLGGAEMTFFTAGIEEPAPIRSKAEVRVLPFLERNGGQPVEVEIHHFYTTPADVAVRVGSKEVARLQLKPGRNPVEFQLPEAKELSAQSIEVLFEGRSANTVHFEQKPVRAMTIYVTPHSHTDIGYTEIQTRVEAKQVKNLADGIAAAQKTWGYPEGARYIWNVEVSWAVDLYLQRHGEAGRKQLLEAVRKGQVAVNGMYLNELTGLARPEELAQLFRFSSKFAEESGAPIDAAMISDVPGLTWGTVVALQQAGIKYLSAAPNYFDRIGDILQVWENKPFYWQAADGKSKVLVWIPFWGYAMSHIYNEMSPKLVGDLFEGLEKRNYPYDIAYVRWAGHGDNATPDPAISDFVRDWNAKYIWPRFVISAARDPFVALEKKYGSQIPVVRGDLTPYWEDGAGSSALQTAQNRNASDRLTSAAAAFAMFKAGAYPRADFDEAWRNILLYSEHTWGAAGSITAPDRKDTLEQWAIKRSYADKGDELSSKLLESALRSSSTNAGGAIEVVNTLSWQRDELVVVPAALSTLGDLVKDVKGRAIPSQRLRSGDLAFMAKNVEPFATARYVISGGTPPKIKDRAIVRENVVDTGRVIARVDSITGGILELKAKGIDGNFVNASSGEALNEYIYFLGDDLKNARRNGEVRISVGESGPLVASLVIESAAPGCKLLRRELRAVSGQDYIELINLVDKERLSAQSYYAKEGKESVNFAFPFNVPNGQILFDIPLAAFRPEFDQLPGSCKNWVPVGRWADVSNNDRGVTWVTLDAPLVEVGELSARLLNSQTNPSIWRHSINKTQKFYSWIMNNHWGTNYRAYQEGPTIFRYVLRPHSKGSDPAAASRFATQFTQPLWVRRAEAEITESLLTVSNHDVIVTGLKPSDDGKALIVRLFGASGKSAKTRLKWRQANLDVHLSGTNEKSGERVGDEINVPGYGLVTLRAELDAKEAR